MTIKAVIFDIDNTLYNYDAAHASAFQAVSDYVCRNFVLSEAAFLEGYQSSQDEQLIRAGATCAAIHNRLLRCQIFLERLGRPIAYAPKMAGLYWSVFLDAMRPFPDLYPCFTELKRVGYRVGIGTNMTADYQYAKLRRLELLDYIDFLVTSEEVNAEKPDAKLFLRCAEKAGCPPGECVFVGDSLRHDVEGAKNAGMWAVWIPIHPDAARSGIYGEAPSETRTETADIPLLRSLAELPALLRSMEKQESAL